jgi:hypothetical protein
MSIETLPKLKASVGRFIGLLLNSATQTHIYHLQTKSYATHMALGDYYGEIRDLADSIAEMYQGSYQQIIRGFTPFTPVEDDSPINHLLNVLLQVQSMRYEVFKKEDTQIQNEIDTVVALINSTIYKIKFLS